MATSGLIVVDKPPGMTSHDVVARVRRIAGTRKVGHAGTLDPMATGVLVVGVERATKLLGYVMGHDKTYRATVRLGQSTTTDDRESELSAPADTRGVTDEQIAGAFAAQTGTISQVPSTVSAIKIGGKRAYALAREGQDVELAAREVSISRIELHRIQRADGLIDVDVTVDCSTGTYIRAIARDVGVDLGVGGHLTALRRTAIGEITDEVARGLDELAALDDPVAVPLAEAVRRTLGVREITADEARELSFGRRIAADDAAPEVSGARAPDGSVVALVTRTGKPVVVFAPA